LITILVPPPPPRLIANLPDTSFAVDDTLSYPLADFLNPAATALQALSDSGLVVLIDPLSRVATLHTLDGWKGTTALVFSASDSTDRTTTDTIQVSVLNIPPVVGNLPNLFLDAGTQTQLNLDSTAYTRDDEPLTNLTWSSITNAAFLTIEIDPVSHRATIAATADTSGLSTLIFRATDAQGATAADTLTVTVLAAIDTVVITPPDTTSIDTVVITPPDTTSIDTVVITPPDTTIIDTVVITPPDTTSIDTVVITPPDTTIIDTVVITPPDTTIIDTVVITPPDTTSIDTVVITPPDTTSIDTVVITPPDTTTAENQAPIVGPFTALTVYRDGSHRLVLDRHAQDDQSIADLVWTAISNPGVQVSIDPAKRHAVITPFGSFLGQTQIVFRATDAQDSTATDTLQVTVALPPPGDLDSDGMLSFSDLFRLVDSIGLTSFQVEWDPRHDLNDDGRISFEDLFKFVDLISPPAAQ